MRSRDPYTKRPCELCKTLTAFQYEIKGGRGGHIRWADVCPSCGEQTALTKDLK